VYEIFANLAPGKCEFTGGNPLSASSGQACLFGVICARKRHVTFRREGPSYLGIGQLFPIGFGPELARLLRTRRLATPTQALLPFGRLGSKVVLMTGREGMGHLKSTELPGALQGARGFRDGLLLQPRNRRWLWIVALVVLIALGIWYSKSKDSAEAQGPGGRCFRGERRPGAGGEPGNRFPVVVATAQRGDLPVYFNGLGNGLRRSTQ